MIHRVAKVPSPSCAGIITNNDWKWIASSYKITAVLIIMVCGDHIPVLVCKSCSSFTVFPSSIRNTSSLETLGREFEFLKFNFIAFYYPCIQKCMPNTLGTVTLFRNCITSLCTIDRSTFIFCLMKPHSLWFIGCNCSMLHRWDKYQKLVVFYWSNDKNIYKLI